MRKPPASETGAVDACDRRKPPASETGAVDTRDMRKPPASETGAADARDMPASETGAADARDMPSSETGAVNAHDMRQPPRARPRCAKIVLFSAHLTRTNGANVFLGRTLSSEAVAAWGSPYLFGSSLEAR